MDLIHFETRSAGDTYNFFAEDFITAALVVRTLEGLCYGLSFGAVSENGSLKIPCLVNETETDDWFERTFGVRPTDALIFKVHLLIESLNSIALGDIDSRDDYEKLIHSAKNQDDLNLKLSGWRHRWQRSMREIDTECAAHAKWLSEIYNIPNKPFISSFEDSVCSSSIPADHPNNFEPTDFGSFQNELDDCSSEDNTLPDQSVQDNSLPEERIKTEDWYTVLAELTKGSEFEQSSDTSDKEVVPNGPSDDISALDKAVVPDSPPDNESDKTTVPDNASSDAISMEPDPAETASAETDGQKWTPFGEYKPTGSFDPFG